MPNNLFPERTEKRPQIYAYRDKNQEYEGLLKVGYTAIDVEKRVAQQYPTKRPDGLKPYEIVWSAPAMFDDGSSFMDFQVREVLKKQGIVIDGEWCACDIDAVKSAYLAVLHKKENIENRTQDFAMRPEQAEAVDKTYDYFKKEKDKTPKFLWNAKMRFGKTFASYELAKKLKAQKVLILTFKPAVQSAWEEDLNTHINFEGWQFVSRGGKPYEECDDSRPIVCFGSFQDYLGTDANGNIKTKNEWVHTTNWDLVIFDEYHFGAWRDNARKLFLGDDEESDSDFNPEDYKRQEADNAYNESWLPITSSRYLYLSGTPFRAINSGEFIEDQIYNWTYSDEQRAKEEWGDNPNNPYKALPRMVMMTYKIPDEIQRIAKQGEFNEFDLNVFFSAENGKFVYENEVQKWLDLIRGAYLPTTVDELKLGGNKSPKLPFKDAQLLSVLTHTLWFLPNVASCEAMKNLLESPYNQFYHQYKVNMCAGASAGIGLDAVEPVKNSMRNPLESKTITLSCGKLTTGVTIKPWTGVFMLRNLSSPETYFQTAFRVQSPWEMDIEGGGKEIIKHECYVFDFALDRALRQISDYSIRLNTTESNPEKKVGEFISFLPVIAYDGSIMRQISASEILDIALAGTSATLLAKRWESALLVNVDNETLSRLMASEEAMQALSNIEGFRSLNQDIETIINKSESVKKAKKSGEELTPKEKKELSEEEKEYKSKRKMIQEKLIKFATRIPVFMYLTDFREHSLKDVITQLEPTLFKRVTGLEVADFELLVSLGVFNGNLMNDAVYKFKRYEDNSLSYTGIDRHEGEKVGGYDTTLSGEEYQEIYGSQQQTMTAPNFMEVVEEVAEEKETPTADEKPIIRNPFGRRKTEEKPKKKVDVSNIDIGSIVWHKAFGEGEVIELDDTRIWIKFGKAKKMFAFPDVFQTGLLAENL